MDHPGDKPVIIIGAGVVGLSLAHGLANAGIPFEVYERDEAPTSRGQGWAITFHWCLPFLRNLLRPEAFEAIERTQVDPEMAINDTGNFLFLNLASLEIKFRIPPNQRRRVNRERFRQVLLEDERVAKHVHWGQRLAEVEVDNRGSPKVTFEDGSFAEGRVLVGAEGTRSKTREFVAPDNHQNQSLPVKMLGTAVKMTLKQVKPLRDIDPLLFQGCHPETNTFLWVSALDTPATNGSEGTPEEYYLMQLVVSWPVAEAEDVEIPSTDALRAEEMKRRAKGFHPTLLSAIDLISSTGENAVQDVALQDWACPPWNNHNGAVTLTGDAAHAMTMYRGEAANHGIMDAFYLVQNLKALYDGEKGRKEAIEMYEKEMRERTSVAVEWSREACIGAHDYDGLNEKSAVLRRRAIKMPDL